MAAALLSASSAHAAGQLTTESFSDSLPWTPMTHGQEMALKSQQCISKATSGSMSFATGLKDARSALSKLASAKALKKLSTSKDTSNPRMARVTAASAMLDRRPDAALAALLDAQSAHPRTR